MSQKYFFDFFELVIPDKYEVVKNEDNTFYIVSKGNGVGALTISVYQIPETYKFDSKSEINDFLLSIDGYTDKVKKEIKLNGEEEAIIEFVTLDNAFWKCWVSYSKKNKVALFATYNCNNADKGIELNIMNTILRTISFCS